MSRERRLCRGCKIGQHHAQLQRIHNAVAVRWPEELGELDELLFRLRSDVLLREQTAADPSA